MLAIAAHATSVGRLALTATLILGHELDALELIVDFNDIGLVRLIFFEFSDLFFNVKHVVEIEFFPSSDEKSTV